MIKKNIVIFGASELAKEIGKQIINSKSLNLLGFIREDSDDKLAGLMKYDLGCDPEVLLKLKPDLCAALDYHKLIPSKLTSSFRIINSHGGILPEDRGYHVLGWSFINGSVETGYTLHLMDDDLDSGDILYIFRYAIKKTSTFNDLKKAIYLDQKKSIVKVIEDYLNKKIKVSSQKDRYPKYYSKRNISDCMIDWNNTSEFINRFIRALSKPAGPGAFTIYNSKRLTVMSSEIYPCKDYIEIPGHVVYKKGDRILVKTKDKCIWIEDVIYDNKLAKAGKVIKKNGARLGLNITEEFLKSGKFI